MNVAVTNIRPAGDRHQVVTVEGKAPAYRRRPCSDCPWRKDAVGKFPAEAFRHSAGTAYDMSEHQFGCHQSLDKGASTCAGFLLRGSAHNLAARVKAIKGEIDLRTVCDGGVELFDSYRDMAEANGVAADDPVLEPCR